MPFHPIPVEIRFWRYVDAGPADDCWLWRGSLNGRGYGVLQREGHLALAHRISYEMHIGPIPDGVFVCHNCPSGDNKRCVNPRHLWLGTAAENTADMIAKGRQYYPGARNPARGERSGSRLHPESVCRGEQNGQARLTEAQVREIRRLREQGMTFYALAARYLVAPMTIHKITTRRTWAHVT